MELKFSVNDCLEYGIELFVGRDELAARMAKGEVLKVKLGIDPTSPNLHLGRGIALWRLRAFQELGHQIHLIIGDYTAQVGDTSDKESERPMLTPETVQANLASYEKQLWLILNPEKRDQVHFHYNSSWLKSLTFESLFQLADCFSVNSFIKRELVAKRLEAGGRVSLREMLYPLMQGYDSVQLEPDVEIGGSDQWFNMLAGRTLMEHQGQTAQAVLAHGIVSAADGSKMSSSKGNVISLNQDYFGLFTQMMQIPDQQLAHNLAFFPRAGLPFTAEELLSALESGQNPRNLKLKMAQRMVALLWGEPLSVQALERWENEATQQQIPEQIEECPLEPQEGLLSILVRSELAPSNAEAKRLLLQRAVKLNQLVIQDQAHQPQSGDLLQVGKHKFRRLT